MFEYIILAHNNTETRSILYEILSDLGYKVTTVLTHGELMEIVKKERPHFILVDPTVFDIANQTVKEKIEAIDKNIKFIILEENENRVQTIQDIIKILREKPASLPIKEETVLNINILAVDDEKDCRELIEKYLSRKGYSVDTASSGEEAIAKVKANKPNVVFLDIRLPGMDGLLVLKRIKDMDKTIGVIMTSALGEERVIKEAMELGADGYLVKPFNMSKLEATIFCNVLHKCLE